MRSLLDVSVLVALLDQDRSLHVRTRECLGAHARDGWAWWALTTNGCMRIMSHSGYPNPLPVAQIATRLRHAVTGPYHEFWPNDVSLFDERVTDATHIHGSRQVTELYLLALAGRHDGKFVTFYGAIAVVAVRGAANRHLIVL